MMTQVSDFLRESHRIDQQIWDALCLRSGETVLWCGIPGDTAWIDRAREVGVKLTIIEGDSDRIRDAETSGHTVLRGSTTMIPAKHEAFDVAVAFHYLHEIDPSFHAQVVGELARVSRRVVIIEPAPPADLLGRRIAQLYALAKREQGSFENYQPVDYWRKLLAIVKADVALETLTFRRVPPKHAVEETVRLVLRAMAAEDLPESYLEELRALARRPDAQLLPLSRYVVIGAATGALPTAGAGTRFRPNESLDDTPPALPTVAAARAPRAPQRTEWTPPEIVPELPEVVPAAAAPPPAPAGPRPFVPPAYVPEPAAETSADAGEPLAPETPAEPSAPEPPAAPRQRRRGRATPLLEAPDGGAPVPETAPAAEEPPFGAPFAVPVDLDPFADPASNPMPRYGQADDAADPFAYLNDDGTKDPFGNEPAPRAPAPGWTWEPPEDEHPA